MNECLGNFSSNIGHAYCLELWGLFLAHLPILGLPIDTPEMLWLTLQPLTRLPMVDVSWRISYSLYLPKNLLNFSNIILCNINNFV